MNGQLKDMHSQNDKLRYQVFFLNLLIGLQYLFYFTQLMMMSNELGERNSLIDEMKKMHDQYEQKLVEKDNLYKQDSIVRLQLGKRLEQVLMDKAEAEVLTALQFSHLAVYGYFFLYFFRRKWNNCRKKLEISCPISIRRKTPERSVFRGLRILKIEIENQVGTNTLVKLKLFNIFLFLRHRCCAICG
jgi:hypothetical protein